MKDYLRQLVTEGRILYVGKYFHDGETKPLFGPNYVQLDDEANVSVFWNEDQLANIREDGHFLSESIGPQHISSNPVGDTADFGTVKYMPEAWANILCSDDVADRSFTFATSIYQYCPSESMTWHMCRQ